MMSSTLTIKVSIEDIVLPLPGHDVIYPNNQGQYRGHSVTITWS